MIYPFRTLRIEAHRGVPWVSLSQKKMREKVRREGLKSNVDRLVRRAQLVSPL